MMRLFILLAIGIDLASRAALSPAAAQQFTDTQAEGNLIGIFDEIRFGGSFSVQDSSPDGLLVNGQLLFTTFVPAFDNYFLNTLLRPRPHIWATVATDDGPNQLSGGLTWNFPIFDRFFLEGSFGATWHDGPIDSPPGGDDLGCHFMFRESVGIGANFGEHWRAIVLADHASHADFCDGGNSGLTHVGLYAGYRF